MYQLSRKVQSGQAPRTTVSLGWVVICFDFLVAAIIIMDDIYTSSKVVPPPTGSLKREHFSCVLGIEISSDEEAPRPEIERRVKKKHRTRSAQSVHQSVVPVEVSVSAAPVRRSKSNEVHTVSDTEDEVANLNFVAATVAVRCFQRGDRTKDSLQ